MARPSLRDNIIAGGLRVIHQRGYHGTSVQDIADAAGAPKGSFTNHFESKEAFALAVIDKFYAQAERFTQAIFEDVTLSPRERLARYFEQLSELLLKETKCEGCLLGNMGGEMSAQSEPIRQRLRSRFSAWSGNFTSLIREGQRSGDFKMNLSAEVLADFLINSWEGAILRTKIDRSPDALGQFRAVVAHLLFT